MDGPHRWGSGRPVGAGLEVLSSTEKRSDTSRDSQLDEETTEEPRRTASRPARVTDDNPRFMDCSLPGSSVHAVLQARILEWVALSSSRGSSQLRDQTPDSCTAGRFYII